VAQVAGEWFYEYLQPDARARGSTPAL
jgi:hypothetical protein